MYLPYFHDHNFKQSTLNVYLVYIIIIQEQISK